MRINFLNKIYAMCNTPSWDGVATPDDILKAVRKYRRKTGNNKRFAEYKVSVENGCLFLDGTFVLRIEPLVRPLWYFNEMEDYYEGLCLGDQA